MLELFFGNFLKILPYSKDPDPGDQLITDPLDPNRIHKTGDRLRYQSFLASIHTNPNFAPKKSRSKFHVLKSFDALVGWLDTSFRA
jgi:hypothetical protein